MIIRTHEQEFILIKQHDHGFLSGEMARHFNPQLLESTVRIEDAVLAAYEHDRSWIGLDKTPIWHDAEQAPYTFMDFPLALKLAFYRSGLDEIEAMNPYASLLCSMHFASFFHLEEQQEVVGFLRKERERQKRLREQIGELPEELIQSQFRLLQFCDDLSLFVCLNEPGASKEDEFPWYQEGFERTEPFNPDTGKPLVAKWVNEKEIRVAPFPFTVPFTTVLKYKRVAKENIQAQGIEKAYQAAPWLEQEVTFVQ
ncbi:DUF3891 family protein [Paenibacillus apiarius]|uniref:DUF3891 family protein n=1 Tax=Paenibacillus apiarius TaxID=46240 RepID=UPI003B3ADC6D